MKRPYEVYKIYKQTQKKYLKREIEKCFRVCPGNCVYNQVVPFDERGMDIPMCLLGAKVKGDKMDCSNLLICSEVSQAKECNAYSPKYNDVAEIMEKIRKETQDPEIKRKKYPELATLEVIMGNTLHSLRQKRQGILTKLLFKIIEKLEKCIQFVN